MPTDLVYSDETGDFIGVVRSPKDEDRYVAIPASPSHPKLFDYRSQAVEWLNSRYNLCHM